MALFNVRLDDQLAVRFDVWADGHGGRSAALRHVIRDACERIEPGRPRPMEAPARPLKLTLRLAPVEAANLRRQAAPTGLTANAWAGAALRYRLQARPTFPRDQTLLLIAMQGELRRIGVNVNQIARALNVAVMEGRVLELEMDALEALRAELRAHILALRDAFEGNLSYWAGQP